MKNKGFTLIELLVVIAILGILAALATVSFTGSQKQARDVRRKSDLKVYQTALEIYANKNNGLYPVCGNGGAGVQSQICPVIMGTSDPKICPDDPKYDGIDPNFSPYKYQTDGDPTTCPITPPTATKFVLWAKLENTTGYWVVCSSGSSFISTTTPSIGSCP